MRLQLLRQGRVSKTGRSGQIEGYFERQSENDQVYKAKV